MLKDGKLNSYWMQTNNNLQAAPNSANETCPGYRNPDNFIVVPTPIRPSPRWRPIWCCRRRCGWRRKVRTAMPNGARISGISWSIRRARRAPTSGRSWSSPSGSRPTRSGRPRSWRPIRRSAARRCSTCCSATARWTASRSPNRRDVQQRRRRRQFGFYLQKGLFEEYAAFGRGHGHDLAPFDTYHQVRGLRWPVVDGKETRWRYREGFDPYVKPGEGVRFYGRPDGRAVILAAPYEPPAESAGRGLRVLAGHRAGAGALAFRLHDDARAGAVSRVPRRAGVHESGGCPQARHQPGRRRCG